MVAANARWAESSLMADVHITEFTDPGCPWAYSAEPSKRRLNWLYGDRIEWDVRLVVLAESPSEYEDEGFDTGKQSEAFKKISREHGMPIDTRERPRMGATLPSCLAVVAARREAPELTPRLLRRLRIRFFSGELLDEQATIDGAAVDAGLDPSELQEWMAQPETERELREDMTLARGPMPAARVLDHKLANWSGGRRYTCPSYEIVRREDGVRIAVPGFQPFGVYDVITANLVPGLDRRDDPDSVEQVLEWCATPVATQEVAVLCGISHDEAREQLGRVADEEHLGYDGFWTLR